MPTTDNSKPPTKAQMEKVVGRALTDAEYRGVLSMSSREPTKRGEAPAQPTYVAPGMVVGTPVHVDADMRSAPRAQMGEALGFEHIRGIKPTLVMGDSMAPHTPAPAAPPSPMPAGMAAGMQAKPLFQAPLPEEQSAGIGQSLGPAPFVAGAAVQQPGAYLGTFKGEPQFLPGQHTMGADLQPKGMVAGMSPAAASPVAPPAAMIVPQQEPIVVGEEMPKKKTK